MICVVFVTFPYYFGALRWADAIGRVGRERAKCAIGLRPECWCISVSVLETVGGHLDPRNGVHVVTLDRTLALLQETMPRPQPQIGPR